MARQTLTPQQLSRSGITPSFTAAHVDGHKMANGGTEYLHVKTGDTATVVTIQTPGTVDGLAVAERTISIGTSSERLIGPFPRQTYNQGSEEVYVDLSAITNVTLAAFRPS